MFVQNDTLLSADVFQNSQNMCLEIYELAPAHFLSAPGLVWQAGLEKAKVKLYLFVWYQCVINGRKWY